MRLSSQEGSPKRSGLPAVPAAKGFDLVSEVFAFGLQSEDLGNARKVQPGRQQGHDLFDAVDVVAAVAAGSAFGPLGIEQAPVLVHAQHLGADAGQLGGYRDPVERAVWSPVGRHVGRRAVGEGPGEVTCTGPATMGGCCAKRTRTGKGRRSGGGSGGE